MTQITFYLLDNHPLSPEQFACRLVDKAWRSGLPMHIHTVNEQSCQFMDQLLWSWREYSFLPHAIMNDDDSDQHCPITLGFRQPTTAQKPLLINLSPEVPDFFRDFSRVCEVVVQHPDQKAISRAKFRAYRQTGIEPEVHTMKAL